MRVSYGSKYHRPSSKQIIVSHPPLLFAARIKFDSGCASGTIKEEPGWSSTNMPVVVEVVIGGGETSPVINNYVLSLALPYLSKH